MAREGQEWPEMALGWPGIGGEGQKWPGMARMVGDGQGLCGDINIIKIVLRGKIRV